MSKLQYCNRRGNIIVNLDTGQVKSLQKACNDGLRHKQQAGYLKSARLHIHTASFTTIVSIDNQFDRGTPGRLRRIKDAARWPTCIDTSSLGLTDSS